MIVQRTRELETGHSIVHANASTIQADERPNFVLTRGTKHTEGMDS